MRLLPAPLSARSARHRAVEAALRSPVRQALGQLTLLEYAASDGHVVRLPVQYAQWGDQLVLAAGGARNKTWWRAFRTPRPATVLLDGVVVEVRGRLVPRDDPDRPVVVAAYDCVHRLAHADDAELVLLTRSGPRAAAAQLDPARAAPPT